MTRDLYLLHLVVIEFLKMDRYDFYELIQLENEKSKDILEEYENMFTIIEDVKVEELDDAKTYIELCSNEVKRLKEIVIEARTYSRVHTKAYTRSLDENTRMSNKLGRKSLLPPIRYVVEENNARYADGALIVDCYCCSKSMNIDNVHRSHIIAKELGGSCDPDNIRLCCKSCNLEMGVMDMEIYKSQKVQSMSSLD